MGVATNLERRVWEPKQSTTPSFTQTYNVTQLVSFEESQRIDDGIAREKRLKDWRRTKTFELVEGTNPWLDLSAGEYDGQRSR